MKDKTLMNKIGSLPMMPDGHVTDDNLAIAIVTYFENCAEKPEDAEINDEVGWSFWAIEKTDDLLLRVIKEALKEELRTCHG
jgi:hypothetical protein